MKKNHFKRTAIIALLLVLALLVFAEAYAVAETAEAPAPVFTIDLTQIVVSIIGIVFSFLIAWLARVIVPPVKKWLEARTTAQQREQFNLLVRQLVLAAEQTLGAGKGGEKLKYVCEQLTDRGYKIDLAAIEATVKEMNDTLLTALLENPDVLPLDGVDPEE